MGDMAFQKGAVFCVICPLMSTYSHLLNKWKSTYSPYSIALATAIASVCEPGAGGPLSQFIQRVQKRPVGALDHCRRLNCQRQFTWLFTLLSGEAIHASSDRATSG